MSATGERMEERDLHAWVDGHLTPAREKAIETYFTAHPEVRERWRQYVDQRAALRAAFAAQTTGPIPARGRLSPHEIAVLAAVVLHTEPMGNVLWPRDPMEDGGE